jgi:hypothetical protein
VSASAVLCKTHQRKCTSMRTSDGFPSYSFHRTRAKNHAERGISWLSPTQAREDSGHRIEPAICALQVDHFL